MTEQLTMVRLLKAQAWLDVIGPWKLDRGTPYSRSATAKNWLRQADDWRIFRGILLMSNTRRTGTTRSTSRCWHL